MEESNVTDESNFTPMSKPKVKVMFFTFFNVRGIVHCDFCHKTGQSSSKSTERSCSVCFALSAREEIRVVAGEIVAAQGSTNLIFVCTDFCACKMVLHTQSCT